jgi:glycosyl transferase family 25
MKKIIEYFDRAYVINLQDRIDRRRQAEREFFGIGIDIPNQKVKFFTATRPTEKGAFPSVGIRGNFTSHKEVLKLANDDRLRNVLVFEDDISFRSVDPQLVEKIATQLEHEEWDVVYFGYLSPSDDGLTGPLMDWPSDLMGAHFYAVNGRFIPTMLEYMLKCELLPPGHPYGGPITADGAYNHVRYVIPNIRVLISVPNLAHQRSSRTDLHPTGLFDKIVPLRPLLQWARAVKHKFRMAADRNTLRRNLGR